MIPEDQEPSGLSPEATPVADHYWEAQREYDAINGSAMLRNAILKSMGIAIPPPKVVKKRKVARIYARKVYAPCETVERIKDTVARHRELTDGALSGPRGDAKTSEARQVAIYVARTVTGYSYPHLGRLFGRDHTTALHACREVEKRRSDPDFAEEIDDILALFVGQREGAA